jgi:hypothetical protein
MDQSKVEQFRNTKDCKDCNQNCDSPLDYQMVVPSYLINDVKKELINRLASVYLKIRPDEYPDLNTSNVTNTKDIQTYEAP